MNPPSLPSRLRALKLLRPGPRRRPVSLLRLCHDGRLEGGVSVSLAALPDEVIGALSHAMRGSARSLRVLEVRGLQPVHLEIRVGLTTEKWEIEDLEGLTHNLNDFFAADASVSCVVVLGEWEDMLQLWCCPKKALGPLLREGLLDGVRNLPMLMRVDRLLSQA